MKEKSTLKEIEERFDNDVERFSKLETGQQTTLDATFNMQLFAQGIARVYPNCIFRAILHHHSAAKYTSNSAAKYTTLV